MKFVKLLLIFLLISSTNILAQDQGGISDFEVLPEYLINGKIKIDGDHSTTTFKYKVKFVKRLNPAWHSTSGLAKWLFTTVNFRLVSSLQNYSPYYMEDNRQITIADFPEDDNAFMEKEYTTTITNSYLVAGRTIDLSYQTASMSFFGTKGTSYQFQVVVTPPPPPTYGEGNLVMTTDQKVYSIMDGYARHIQTMATLAGVYNYNGYIINCNCSTLSTPIGTPIGSDTSLLIDTTNGKMYFREGTYIRHIKDVPTANKYFYQIYNNNYIVSVTSLTGYTVGPQIQ